MTTQETAKPLPNAVQELLDALDQRPELRQLIWNRLAPPEILNLPAIVEEIRKGMIELGNRMTRMEERQERMEERQERMEERQDRMETLLNQTAQDVRDLKGRYDGDQYEAKAIRNLEQAGHSAGLRRMKLLAAKNNPTDPSLIERLEDAVDEGLITQENYHEIKNADAIAQARERHTQDWVYLVAEASVTAHPGDVYRAIRRAHLLQQATGTRAIPAVIGARISDEAQRLADQENAVAVRLSL